MINSESREFDATYRPLFNVSASLCMTPCWKKDINALDICRLCLWINNHFALCFSTVSSIRFWGVALYTVSLTVCFSTWPIFISYSGADFVLQFNCKQYSFNIIYYFGNEGFIRLSKSSGQWYTKMRGSGTQGFTTDKTTDCTCGLKDTWVTLAIASSKGLHHSIYLLCFTGKSETPQKLPARERWEWHYNGYNGYLMDLCLRKFMKVCMILSAQSNARTMNGSNHILL